MEFSVYVHVPYCRVQCPYCTFYTVLRPAPDGPLGAFLAAVWREWELRVQPRLRRGDRLRTLYLGGGTPSDLPAAALHEFLQRAAGDLPGGLGALDEVTVECNPESAGPEMLDALRSAGVGRISLGLQALDVDDLRALGRVATVQQSRAALAAVGARFPTWNADLILGIPGSEAVRLVGALEALLEAGAPHLSFYCLELPPGRARQLGDPGSFESEDAKARLYELASAWVEAHGYEHYEISNAALPGHESIHNTAYWRGREYVGLGPGAHSLEAGVRRANRPDLRLYSRALEQGEEPPSAQEELTPAMRLEEHLLLGLRLKHGLDADDPAFEGRQDLLQGLETRGLLRCDGARVRLSARGWLLSDSIVLQLLAS